MKTNTTEYLEKHQSATPSKWKKEAEWRRKNAKWLVYSQKIAVMVLLRMKELKLSQKALADSIGCTQQYISKILHGNENLSLEMISKLQEALDLKILAEETI